MPTRSPESPSEPRIESDVEPDEPDDEEPTFEIRDGVRRAKANQMLGNVSIQAEVIVNEQSAGVITIPIESLRSPNKVLINVAGEANLTRWRSALQEAAEGTAMPIEVQPGARGAKVRDIKIVHEREQR